MRKLGDKIWRGEKLWKMGGSLKRLEMGKNPHWGNRRGIVVSIRVSYRTSRGSALRCVRSERTAPTTCSAFLIPTLVTPSIAR